MKYYYQLSLAISWTDNEPPLQSQMNKRIKRILKSQHNYAAIVKIQNYEKSFILFWIPWRMFYIILLLFNNKLKILTSFCLRFEMRQHYGWHAEKTGKQHLKSVYLSDIDWIGYLYLRFSHISDNQKMV